MMTARNRVDLSGAKSTAEHVGICEPELLLAEKLVHRVCNTVIERIPLTVNR